MSPRATAAPAGLHERILQWYAANARDLPWRRESCSPWGVFVSEIMLQQTPVARVEPVWHEWMGRWPTPADLAADTPGEAVRAWGRLGYPRRALRLHAAAVAMVDSHGGAVPDTVEGLLSLPGVGSYTASAVAAFAFGVRTTVVDTNIRRVFARAIGGDALAAPSLTRAETALAESLVPDDLARARTWNVAVMELGALVCTARSPRCDECPLSGTCAWHLAGHPPYDGPARRGQAWHGTDRQVRGRIVQALRDHHGPLSRAALLGVWPDDEVKAERCLSSLIEDGLIEPTGPDDAEEFRLPA